MALPLPARHVCPAPQFSVLLAQPSVCRREGSYTCWEALFQHPAYRLRYTNFVEIMAPALRMDFFQAVVRHTLKGTYTGELTDAWPRTWHSRLPGWVET